MEESVTKQKFMSPLAELGKLLKDDGYRFTTVTPETHARYMEKNLPAAPLRDLFGWSRPVPRSALPPVVLELLSRAETADFNGDNVTSRVRFSTLGAMLFAHSAYPTVEKDSVFFGPDSYRFVRFVRRYLRPGARVVDIGCGSGVGGLSVADTAREVILTDINERALRFAAANAEINGLRAEVLLSDLFAQVPAGADTVIANPPFIADPEKRSYRDGGEGLGCELSARIAEAAVEYLPAGGELLLYTATCFVNGIDLLAERLAKTLSSPHVDYDYEEIDPDIFGSEISEPHYREAERIAAIGLRIKKH
jgi:SAM-dependent methyltransferase